MNKKISLFFVLFFFYFSFAGAQTNTGSNNADFMPAQENTLLNNTVKKEIHVKVDGELNVEPGDNFGDDVDNNIDESSANEDLPSLGEDLAEKKESISKFLREHANTISINAVEVRGWDVEKKKEFLGTVRDVVEVKTDKELENFARGVLLKDENIKLVEVSFDKVRVDYQMPVKFLGIFKTQLNAIGEVDAEGKVKIKFPWFSFLFSKSVKISEVQKDVQKAVNEIKIQQASQKAGQILTTLSSIMKTSHDSAKSIIRNIR